MQTTNVLVFPCGTEIANEVINALKGHKYFRTVYASSEGNSYCHFRGKRVHDLPYVSDEGFLPSLQELIEKESIDFIVPAHDDVAYGLSRIADRIDAKVIGQSAAVNEIVRFKDRTYDFFRGKLPLAEIFDDEAAIRYPIFVKPKRGQGSQDSFAVDSPEAFAAFKGKYDADAFVWMELLTGAEYTIDCFSDRGNLLYVGPRTRDRTSRGIATVSHLVRDPETVRELEGYAQTISRELKLHGIWFFQMKRDRDGRLKLLEVGPRVSGTMMLNRARGVNFVELALYQAMDYPVKVIHNDIDVSLARALVPIYRTDIEYERLYVDFDDTLFLEEKYINADLMRLIFQAKNEGKAVVLITKNKKNNLSKALHRFGIAHVFDDIVHLREDERKTDFMEGRALLIDDSFAERKEAIEAGFYATGVDGIDALGNSNDKGR